MDKGRAERVQGQRMNDLMPIFRKIGLSVGMQLRREFLWMTERILDRALIAIPNRHTRGRGCSYPRTTGFSCVAPVRAQSFPES